MNSLNSDNKLITELDGVTNEETICSRCGEKAIVRYVPATEMCSDKGCSKSTCGNCPISVIKTFLDESDRRLSRIVVHHCKACGSITYAPDLE
ncbi:MAG: hypothetical protein HQ568_02520 [Calditrichaeota bacterium]|nr:hypothetical protein [Calditrichota bacterium]